MRIVAIGDIHGDRAALDRTLERIEPREGDEFVFLGDLIDRGPDTRGVIDVVVDLAQRYQVHPIMGNHEQMMLAAYSGGKSDLGYWLQFGGRETLQSYGWPGYDDWKDRIPPGHWRLFGSLLDYYETDTHIFVHASYVPDLPLERTSGDVLRWDMYNPKVGPHSSGKKVYCGHVPGTAVRDCGHACCIDTGCGRAGKLTAVDVESGEIWTS